MADEQVRVDPVSEPVKLDTNDPYFLHPSDHPGLTLVTPPFSGKGYGEWRRSIRMALSAKNKVGFINGAIVRPAADSSKFGLWERCNDMVFSWITNCLSPEIKCSVIYNDTAQAVWRQLDSRFNKVGGTQMYSILQELVTTMQGTSAFSDYFTKVKILWDELDGIKNLGSCSCEGCTCNYALKFRKYEENLKIMQLLMGLNEAYTVARGSILMMEPLPDVDRIYFLLSQEENQRESKSIGGSAHSEGMSMHAKTSSSGSRNTSSGSGGSVSNSRNYVGSVSGKGNLEKEKGKFERKPLFYTNC